MSLSDTLLEENTTPQSERDGTVQWSMEMLQVVNWGGFAGVHTLVVDRTATLLSGQSGTGKSTLLDANIALLMPATTAFNGASNDTGGGRVRGQEQRSLLSYLRGQVDTTTDADNASKAKVLRGDGKPTWGAVAGRFLSDTGHRFTVLRLYYVPAAATKDGDIIRRMVTFEGALDVSSLEPLAQEKFANAAVRAAFPGATPHETYGAFINKVCTRLGIGAGGDGAKALELLARIQAGRQIRTVDELYKAMVLEEPATFAAADLALKHFDELDDTYQKMIVERAKAELLERLPELSHTYDEAGRTLERLNDIGLNARVHSPLTGWEAQRESDMVAVAESATATTQRAAEAELKTAEGTHASAQELYRQAFTAFTAGGGGRLVELEAQVLAEQQEKTRRTNRRATLDEATRPLELDTSAFDDADQYAETRKSGTAFLDEYPSRERALDEQLGVHSVAILDAKREITALTSEITGAKARPGRIPEVLDQQRTAVCAAAGLSRHQLPFLAELLDLKPDQESWRTAVEVSLAGAARQMLVPEEHIAHVSAVIDTMRWNYRMRFTTARTGQMLPAPPSPVTVAGKLTVTDTPFAGWVAAYVADPRRNATCVPDASDMGDRGMWVTQAGQTRNATDYAHGRSRNERNVIGSDNTQAVAELEAERAQHLEAMQKAQACYDEVALQRDNLRRHRTAYEAMLAVSFDDIDTGECDARIASLQAEHSQLREADDTLAALEAAMKRAEAAVSAAAMKVGGLRDTEKGLRTRWHSLVSRADKLTDTLNAHQDVAMMAPAAHEQLETWWLAATSPQDRDDLDAWPANRTRLRDLLEKNGTDATNQVKSARRTIETILENYQERYYDPNLTATIASLPDYLRIYSEILATGLADRTAQWRTRLLAWSGEDLVPLTQAMANAVVEIKDRLHPINEILRGLPFGATDDRLRIELTHAQHAHVIAFRRQLAELSSGATRELRPEQMSARFAELKEFMARLRSDKDPRVDRNVADRERLLNVRQHVHITAKRVDQAGATAATYDSLGGKSGGETQELIAFIIGAALRYRLGDQLRDRPRFTPVFLDEAFIKADAEFSGRAVQAWLRLGFQLVIGAPTDKVGALEPHMRAMVSVTKNHGTSRSYLAVMPESRARHLAPGAGTGAA